MKKIIKKSIIYTMIASITIGCIPVNAATKDETIYSKRNNDGTVKNTIVSEHIMGSTEDSTLLKDIINVNGDEEYTRIDNNVTWKGDNIYYQGNTEKELPIDMNITYTLNGEKKELKDILGASGKITINIKYTNKEKHSVKINDKYETLYTPFVITTGLVLDNSLNTNIDVTNGRLTSTGTKSVIAGISAPGLYESLGYDALKNLDNVNISFETTNFKLPSIYAVAAPKILSDSDLDVFDKMDSLYSNVDKLSSATDEIENGTKELNNGITTLNDGLNAEDAGVKAAYTGVKEIKTQISNAVNKMLQDKSAAIDANTLKAIGDSASKAAVAEITTKYRNTLISQADAGVDKTFTEEYKKTVGDTAALQASTSACTNIKTQNPTADCAQQPYATTVYMVGETARKTAIESSYTAAKSAAEQTAIATSSTVAGMVASETAMNVAKQVAEQAKTTAATSVVNQMTTLNNGLDQLLAGLGKLSNGSEQLVDGGKSLSEGSNTLYTGVKTYNETGIKPITNFVNSEVKSAQVKAEKLVDLSNAYQTFDERKTGTEGKSKIVLVVDSEEKTVETKKEETKEEKTSVWTKIKNFFTIDLKNFFN
jgi:putative membrane protein